MLKLGLHGVSGLGGMGMVKSQRFGGYTQVDRQLMRLLYMYRRVARCSHMQSQAMLNILVFDELDLDELRSLK